MTRGFVLLLVLLVSIACAPEASPTTSALTETPMPVPTEMPKPWISFQQSDHVVGYCPKDIDYLISIPPTWVVAEVSCDEVEFEARDEGAIANVTLEDLPNYDSNPQVALEQLAEDNREDYGFENIMGYATTVKVVNLRIVEYDGRDAILISRETTSGGFIYCKDKGFELIVPNAGWGVIENTRWAYKVTLRECKSQNHHRRHFRKIIESFRQL